MQLSVIVPTATKGEGGRGVGGYVVTCKKEKVTYGKKSLNKLIRSEMVQNGLVSHS